MLANLISSLTTIAMLLHGVVGCASCCRGDQAGPSTPPQSHHCARHSGGHCHSARPEAPPAEPEHDREPCDHAPQRCVYLTSGDRTTVAFSELALANFEDPVDCLEGPALGVRSACAARTRIDRSAIPRRRAILQVWVI